MSECHFTLALKVACGERAVRLPALFLAALLLQFPLAPVGQAETQVTLITTGAHDVELRDLGNRTWQIRTTGADPYFFVAANGDSIDLTATPVLTFDYESNIPVGRVLVFVGKVLDAPHMVTVADLERTSGQQQAAINLTATQAPPASPLISLRITLGEQAGIVAKVRNFRVRSLTANEQQVETARRDNVASDRAHRARLVDYLQHKFRQAIDRVAAADKQIRIAGKLNEPTPEFRLAAIPLWADITAIKACELNVPVEPHADGQFEVAIDRYDAQGRDRLLDGWAIVRPQDAGWEAVSAVRYVDELEPRPDLPLPRPTTRKGLGGCPFDHPDIAELGVAWLTLNIVLNDLFYSEPGAGRTAFTYSGRTWYVNQPVVAQYDRMLQNAAERDCVVSAIVLLQPAGDAPPGSWARAACHPDADAGGKYVMPNFAQRAGVEAYAAAMHFLAQRYSRADGKYGRIHHWIMHNEINSGFFWTNAGDKTLLTYLELYYKSMRLTQTLARQFDPQGKALISLDHWWDRAGDARGYRGRELLERLVDFSRREGDFDWGIAFHPYAQDLTNPRTWEDPEALFTFDTPFITFKNLEVLDAWARQSRVAFGDRSFREIQLTEQGLNSRDYSAPALAKQAAGLAYAWAKIKPLESVTAFQYHLWADAREEGGLRLGLRKFADDAQDPLGRKPSWQIFRAIDTADWESATSSARQLIGIQDWSQVRHAGEIK